MKKLDLKLIRDIRLIKAQLITVGLVVATGILYMVGSLISYDTLLSAREKFYSKYNLANAFHYSKTAPRSLLTELSQLPGIVKWEDRLVEEVSVDFEEEKSPTTGLLVSITEMLNLVYLEKGRLPIRADEILLNTAFAEANNLDVDSSITLIIAGKKIPMIVSGIALSPEFVYIFKPGSMLPDNKHYGVFWMNRKSLEAITNKEGTFNHILFEFSNPESNENKKVKEEIKTLLRPYGSLGVQSIDKLPSYSLLNDEFKQLRSTAFFIPLVFLSVAAFILHIVMSRLITKEREQIATFKAIGMKSREIGIHYFKLTSIISLSGTLLGLIFGVYLGDFFRDLYSQYFKFPDLKTVISPGVIVWGLFVGLSSGFIGFYSSFRKIIKLDPATAMRPPMPDNFNASIWEKIFPSHDPRRKSLIRNLTKNPFRTIMIILGLSFAVMIMIIGSFMKDTIGYMMELQFEIIQRENLTMHLTTPREEDILFEISNRKGVQEVEGARSIPVRINFQNKNLETVLQGFELDSKLRRIVGRSYESISVNPGGVFMNVDLANKLGIKEGDNIYIETLEGKQKEFSVVVVGLINEILGQGIYWDRKSLNRSLGEGNMVNQIFIKTDTLKEKDLMDEWKDSPYILGMSSKTQLLKSFQEIVERSMQATSFFIYIFTGIIGVGVIYNTAMVTLSERLYELGSLRILGFRLEEIFIILTMELLIQVVLAIPLGCFLGYKLAQVIMTMNDTEGFRLPAVILPKTYLSAIGFTFFTAIISFLVVYKKLKNMDLLSVLKIRE